MLTQEHFDIVWNKIEDTRASIILSYVIATEEEREQLFKYWDELNVQEEKLIALEKEWKLTRGTN